MFKTIIAAAGMLFAGVALAQPIDNTSVGFYETGQYSQAVTFTTTAPGPAIVTVRGYVEHGSGKNPALYENLIGQVSVVDDAGNPVCTPVNTVAVSPYTTKFVCSSLNLPVGTYTVEVTGVALWRQLGTDWTVPFFVQVLAQ